MFLVCSSDPEGVAYIETANLDGESDLKARSCVAEVPAPSPLTPTRPLLPVSVGLFPSLFPRTLTRRVGGCGPRGWTQWR